MKIISIETSCDETSIALIEAKGGLRSPSFKVVKNNITTQIEVHRPFGGVVPNLAKREHIINLPKIFVEFESDVKSVDQVVVTVGPGLSPALWQGIEFAKKMGKKYNKPVLGVNHLEGHIYSILLPSKENKKPKASYPMVGISVSGGHTNVVLLKSLTKIKLLGQTRDDAAGEAYDKVGKMLGLSYPGGPEIEKLALKGDSKAIPFPRPMKNQGFEFSFSGLKTSVLYYLRDNPKANKADVAASFQEAVLDILITKLERASVKSRAKTIFVCGGVAANLQLRTRVEQLAKKLKVKLLVPDMEYNTDNAAMIAVAGYINILKKKKRKLSAQPNLKV